MGRAFLAIVIAVFDFPKNKMLFVHIDKNVYYKVVSIDKGMHPLYYVSVINGYKHLYVSQGNLSDNIICVSFRSR